MPNYSAQPDTILVGLSGGVDSAVCVRILQEQGFAVHGLFIVFSPAHEASYEAARTAAKELGIPLHVRRCEPLFEQAVIRPFCEAYASGQTPNPCVVCNHEVKFHQLAAVADELGIFHIATGHYARVEEHEGAYHVARAASDAKDQSYMLYRLRQDVLRRLALPLGEFTKSDIRDMARALGLSSAEAPDSQEICFIPDGDYPAYIRQQGFEGLQGNMISPSGTILGPHKGVLHYTVGQRRWLGVALGQPVFVRRILPNGDVHLGFAGQEFSSSVTLDSITTPGGNSLPSGNYEVKIRSMAKSVPCTLSRQNDTYLLTFAQAQRAPAPGQSAVLYDGEFVVGGGFIAQAD